MRWQRWAAARPSIDGERHTMDVVLRLAPGPKATFAEPTFTGNDGVRTRFLRNRLGFRAGDPFDPLRLEEGRRALYDSGLFSTVTVDEGKELTADGQLPITVDVTARAARSVGASLGYQTDTGPNANLFWEHRNLLGAGERLRVVTELGQTLQRLETTFRQARLRLPQAEPARQRRGQEGEHRQLRQRVAQAPGSASSAILGRG